MENVKKIKYIPFCYKCIKAKWKGRKTNEKHCNMCRKWINCLKEQGVEIGDE